MDQPIRQYMHQVLIIGGGPAGLLMARVLSSRCKHVTVLELDMLDGPIARNGRPQSFFAHVNTGFCQEELEKLFPRLCADLDKYGAPVVPWGTPAIRVEMLGGRLPNEYDFGFTTRQVPQEVFENYLRTYVTAIPNVTIVEGARVTGLVMNEDNTLVQGVTVRPALKSLTATSYYACDFLVDCSGPNSNVIEWLSEWGCDAPQETRIDSQLMYAGRHYTNVNMRGALLIGKSDTVKNPKAGILIKVRGGKVDNEGKSTDEYVLTVFGPKGYEPPRNEASFLQFVKDISEDMYTAIAGATPISPIKHYGNCYSRFRDFSKVRNWPHNLVEAGEAKDKGNPRYGTGTFAALQAALALDETVVSNQDIHFYYAEQERRTAFVHSLIKSSEFKYPWTTTTGKYPSLLTKLAVAMFGRLEWVLPYSPELARMLFRVQNGYDDPKQLQSVQTGLAVLASFLPRWAIFRLYR